MRENENWGKNVCKTRLEHLNSTYANLHHFLVHKKLKIVIMWMKNDKSFPLSLIHCFPFVIFVIARGRETWFWWANYIEREFNFNFKNWKISKIFNILKIMTRGLDNIRLQTTSLWDILRIHMIINSDFYWKWDIKHIQSNKFNFLATEHKFVSQNDDKRQ